MITTTTTTTRVAFGGPPSGSKKYTTKVISQYYIKASVKLFFNLLFFSVNTVFVRFIPWNLLIFESQNTPKCIGGEAPQDILPRLRKKDKGGGRRQKIREWKGRGGKEKRGKRKNGKIWTPHCETLLMLMSSTMEFTLDPNNPTKIAAWVTRSKITRTGLSTRHCDFSFINILTYLLTYGVQRVPRESGVWSNHFFQ